jgi:hypothetical protein
MADGAVLFCCWSDFRSDRDGDDDERDDERR